jgi:hypothetical protein
MVHTKLVLKALLVGQLLLSSAVFAAPVVLIDENFNDVTGLPAANSVRSVQDILTNNPAQLPPDTTFGAPAAGDVNVRRADNTINTTAGTSGFDSFFTPVNDTNNFLVLGDAAGIIADAPTDGRMRVSFPFTLPADATAIIVSFDYAFDGTDTNGSAQPNDVFHVELEGIAHTFLNLPSPTFQSQAFSKTLTGLTGGQRLFLSFYLDETFVAASPTVSAAGIDNVLVRTVPEPETGLLLIFGLAGLGLYKRIRKSHSSTA